MKSFELEKNKYEKIKAIYCYTLRCILKKCKAEKISPALATKLILSSQKPFASENNEKTNKLYKKADLYDFAKEMSDLYPNTLIGTLILAQIDGTIDRYENISYIDAEKDFFIDGFEYWKQIYMNTAKAKSKKLHIKETFDKMSSSEILLYDFSKLKLNALIIFKSVIKQKIYQEQNERIKEELSFLYELVKKYTVSYKKYAAMKNEKIKEDAKKHVDNGFDQAAANSILNDRKESAIKSQIYNKQPIQKIEEKE